MHRLLPPRLFGLLLVVTVVLGLLVPLLGPAPWPVRLIGVLPVAAGLGLTLAGSNLFARIGTNIRTFDDPGRLTTAGPFAGTRNPMYIGLTTTLAGAALLVGSLSAWLGPGVFWLTADRWYVPFEEARMRATFGTDYDDYRCRVPRWIGPVRHARERTP